MRKTTLSPFLSVSLLLLLSLLSTTGASPSVPSHLLQRLLQSTTTTTTCYGIILDAGSSSTKLNIMSWPCRETYTIPQISITEAVIQQTQRPGLSTFANNLVGIAAYLKPLIDKANATVALNNQYHTPIFLRATAGMRLLDEYYQGKIFYQVRKILSKSGFLFLDDTWVSTITGRMEGAFGWLSLNYLLGLISQSSESAKSTAQIVEIGGASAQVAFIPLSQITYVSDVFISLPNYNNYNIYSESYLNYGNDLQRNAIILLAQKKFGSASKPNEIPFPCSHPGFTMQWPDNQSIKLVGTNNMEQCGQLIVEYLNIGTCIYGDHTKKNCGVNGQYQPAFDPAKPIYGLSYINTVATTIGITESFTLNDFYIKMHDFCNMAWSSIQADTAKYPTAFAWNYCQGANFVYYFLSQGINIPLDKTIKIASKIGTQTYSWTYASLIYDISQFNCKLDSPVCKIISSDSQSVYLNNQQNVFVPRLALALITVFAIFITIIM